MANNKDSVIFYQGQIDICKRHMTPEQFGRLMFALFEIENGGDPDVDDDIIMAFEFMALQKRIDRKKYEAICEKNRENGKKGGRPKKTEENPKEPNGFFENPNDKIMIREDNDKIREDKRREESVPDVIPSPSFSVISYLNEKTGSSYQVNSVTDERLTELVSLGYTEKDFRSVIDRKCAEWLEDPKMRMFLRPSTLFGPKFVEYLSAPEPIQAEEIKKQSQDKTKLSDQLADLIAEKTIIEAEIDAEENPIRLGPLYDRLAICEDKMYAISRRLEGM